MFGFQGGESRETVVLKRTYMTEAQQLWPFITNYDASTIRNRLQLVRLVKDRSARPLADVETEVDGWMAGKTF